MHNNCANRNPIKMPAFAGVFLQFLSKKPGRAFVVINGVIPYENKNIYLNILKKYIMLDRIEKTVYH